MRSMPNSESVLDEQLKAEGFEKYMSNNHTTIREFSKAHKRGEYVLVSNSYAVPVIDGIYYDNYDSGDRVPMYFYYRKEKC